jgi:release factor glutamine methyltransferase
VKISSLRSLFHTQLSTLYDKREIDAIFFIYIEDIYYIKKHHYFLHLEHEIEFKQADIELLANGYPIQYITKKTTFFNLQLNVNPSVLIPRPETEELVRKILEREKKRNVERSYVLTKILDLCTGSGAIAIALAKNVENVEVWATDISEEALEIAKKNSTKCLVNITFIQHDILKDEIICLPDYLDIIVTNPPYVPLAERSKLHKNVSNYEPNLALFVPDENPLIFYNAIANIAKKLLRKGGVLYFETYEKFHSELSAMLVNLDFKEIELWKDFHCMPRYVSCKKL